MQTFKEWFEEKHKKEVPEGSIPMTWFDEHKIPMVVACACCDTTMTITSAHIDEENFVYCSTCVSDE